jgi:hypothetical protein
MRRAIDADKTAKLSEFRINRIEVQESGISMVGKYPAFMVLIEEAAQILLDLKAENYFQFKALVPGIHPPRALLVTIQWADGLSPAQMVEKLKAQIETMKEGIIK